MILLTSTAKEKSGEIKSNQNAHITYVVDIVANINAHKYISFAFLFRFQISRSIINRSDSVQRVISAARAAGCVIMMVVFLLSSH